MTVVGKPVWEWKCEDPAGVASDSSRNRNAGVNHGVSYGHDPSVRHGKRYGQFDGTSDYLAFDAAAFDTNKCTEGTFECLIRTPDTYQTGVLYALNDVTWLPTNMWEILMGESGGSMTNENITMFRSVSPPIGPIVSLIIGWEDAAYPLFDGGVHHIVVVMDGATTRLWVDGAEKALTVGAGADTGEFMPGPGLAIPPDTVSVGCVRFDVMGMPTEADHYEGRIYHMAVYNRPWTEADVAARAEYWGVV